MDTYGYRLNRAPAHVGGGMDVHLSPAVDADGYGMLLVDALCCFCAAVGLEWSQAQTTTYSSATVIRRPEWPRS